MKVTFLLLTLFLIGCSVGKKADITPVQKETVTDETPKILFINYKISKAEDHSVDADLINTIIANGTFKNTDEVSQSLNKGDYICLQLDEEGGILDQLRISNPLVKNIEYVNEEGSLEVKTIHLETTDLNIRLQLNPETRYISLQIAGDPNLELIKTEL